VKAKVKDTAKCQKMLDIEVPEEKVQEEFERYYNEIKKTAEIPGFRKGKAPKELIEKHFAEKANDRVLHILVNDAYHQIIEKEKIEPVTMPDISNITFKKGEKLTFQAKVDIRPSFTLKEYKNIKIKKEKLEIKEEEVTKVLEYLRERYAKFENAENRAVKINDYLICDYNYTVEGKQIEKKENSWLWVDKEMFMPGLSTKLEGIKTGENKKFSITLPKKFQPTELAGKNAEFEIQVREIKEKKLPELNDEFAKILGKDSLSELKIQINADLSKEKELQIKREMKMQLIDSLVKSMPIDVPHALVERRKKFLIESTRQRLKQQGLNDAQIGEEEKKMSDLFDKEALKQVRTFFILEDIARKENIKVEAKEIDERIGTIARSYNQKKEQVLKYLKDNNMLENIHWDIWEEKIIDFLLINAKIEEVSKK